MSEKKVEVNAFGHPIPEFQADNLGELLCPNCGCENLHQTSVSIFDRHEDAEITTVIKQSFDELSSRRVMSRASGNPSLRRHGLVIEFWCEQCPEDVAKALAIYQHKGTTFVEWQ